MIKKPRARRNSLKPQGMPYVNGRRQSGGAPGIQFVRYADGSIRWESWISINGEVHRTYHGSKEDAIQHRTMMRIRQQEAAHERRTAALAEKVQTQKSAWVVEDRKIAARRVRLEVLTHEADDIRPRHRADCVDGPRPCPWMGCRYHLALDVTHFGGLRYHDPERLDEMAHTCALDVADAGAMTLEEVGAIAGVTRERIRQVEEMATAKVRPVLRRFA
jgi:hypothetical protein